MLNLTINFQTLTKKSDLATNLLTDYEVINFEYYFVYDFCYVHIVFNFRTIKDCLVFLESFVKTHDADLWNLTFKIEGVYKYE